MRIGIPKEIKPFEYRVGATPAFVYALVEAGHQVFVESGAGEKVGFDDAAYIEAGAQSVDAAKAYEAELIVKVKEPQAVEYKYLHEKQILFCYLHLAADRPLTEALIKSRAIAIAYETVTDAHERLPLLIPMSEIAGRIAIQVGAYALQMNNGGKGLVLGGVPGVHPAHVTIIGGGVVGTEAAKMALGLGASVRILDTNLDVLRKLDHRFGPNLKTLFSTPYEIEKSLVESDLVVGSVLTPGKMAPKLITRALLRKMEPGTVIVDVAIDQGGCAETSRPTTHGEPTFIEEKVVHYCVTNMPGACSKTATHALTNATFRYVSMIANEGLLNAFKKDLGLKDGLNVYLGALTNEAVAEDLSIPYTTLSQVK